MLVERIEHVLNDRELLLDAYPRFVGLAALQPIEALLEIIRQLDNVSALSCPSRPKPPGQMVYE